MLETRHNTSGLSKINRLLSLKILLIFTFEIEAHMIWVYGIPKYSDGIAQSGLIRINRLLNMLNLRCALTVIGWTRE